MNHEARYPLPAYAHLYARMEVPCLSHGVQAVSALQGSSQVSNGTFSLPMDDSAWEACAEMALSELHLDERAALIRVANGTATKADAVLLAASLMHGDLFDPHTEKCPTHTQSEDE